MSEFDYGSIGLDIRDMRVYESLQSLEKGSLRAIAEHTGLNRGTVYEIIKKLTGIGLVTFTVAGQQKRYQAADPDVFIALIREHEDRLAAAKQSAKAYADQFRSLKTVAESANFASFYEGDEGVASILRDVLTTVRRLPAKEYQVFSSRGVSEFLYHNFPNFSRQRIRHKIFVRVLAIGATPEKVVHAERKQLTPTSRDARAYTIIYGSKTALITINEQNVPFGIVIDNPGITSMQRLLFNQLWENL